MTIRKRVITALLLFAYCFLMGGQIILSAFSVKATAAENAPHTHVLEDLQKDDNFDVKEYPAIEGDTSIELIHVAEGVSNEIFLYVYQPGCETSDTVLPKKVSISKEAGADFSPELYDLQLVSKSGVFHKYLVEGIEMSSEYVHNYVITSIYRAYDAKLDGDSPTDNTTDYIAVPVGQTWTISYLNDKTYVSMDYEDYITVTSKHVGFLRYEDVWNPFGDFNLDSHYVAFSTDKPIDDLLEVEIIFSYEVIGRSVAYGIVDERVTDSGREKKTLTSEDLFYQANPLWFSDYEYERIQSIDDFMSNEGDQIEVEIKDFVERQQWVVRFFESRYDFSPYIDASGLSYGGYHTSTEVTEVGFLRMMYEYEGKIYNLGVVDNLQSGDTVPDAVIGKEEADFRYLLFLVSIVILLVIVGLLEKPLKLFIDITVSIISVPFKLIGSFFKGK